MKKERGITLIALIITIIVMMILVGVTVTVAINGDVFNKAKEGAQRTEKARWRENLNAALLAMNTETYAEIEEYTINTRDQVDGIKALTKVLNEIEKNFELDSKYVYEIEGIRALDIEKLALEGNAIIDNDTELLDILIVPCKFEGEEIELYIDVNAYEDGEILKIAEFYIEKGEGIKISDEPVKVATVGENVASVTEDGVPIPKGFYYVTGTKNTGVVISDSQADENNEEGNDGNQFVWVPVNVNPRLEIELETEKTIKEIRILNITGYDETFSVNSNYFQKTVNLTYNDVYEVVIKYADGTEEEIVKEANNVYAKSNNAYSGLLMVTDLSEEELFENMKEQVLSKKPDLELKYKVEILKNYAEVVVAEAIEYEDEDKVSESEKNSVLKYGGFYMGRYEAKTTDDITTVKKGQIPTSSISYEDAKIATENMYNDEEKYGVKAELPSAAAWDTIGTWLIKTETKDAEDVLIGSSEWGNIRTSVMASGKKTLKSTGSTPDYRAKNMYDLAGNLEEWTKEVRTTIETDSTTGQDITVVKNISRGGHYNSIGSGFSSSAAEDADQYKGFRPMLYIK